MRVCICLCIYSVWLRFFLLSLEKAAVPDAVAETDYAPSHPLTEKKETTVETAMCNTALRYPGFPSDAVLWDLQKTYHSSCPHNPYLQCAHEACLLLCK